MHYPNDIEEICYEQAHIDEVWKMIEKQLPDYFSKYIDKEGSNNSITTDTVADLATHFGSSAKPKHKQKDAKVILKRLIDAAVTNFNAEQAPYLEHLEPESLEEYGEDVGSYQEYNPATQYPGNSQNLAK